MADMKKVYDDLIIINLYQISKAGSSFERGINKSKTHFIYQIMVMVRIHSTIDGTNFGEFHKDYLIILPNI